MLYHIKIKKCFYQFALIFVMFFFIIFLSCGTILDEYKVSGVWEVTKSEAYIYNQNSYTYKLVNIEIGDIFWADSQKINFIFTNSKELSIVDKSSSVDEFIVISENGKWSIDFATSSIVININQDKRVGYQNKYSIWSEGFSFSNSWPLSGENEMELIISEEMINKKIILYKSNQKVNYIKCYLKKI